VRGAGLATAAAVFALSKRFADPSLVASAVLVLNGFVGMLVMPLHYKAQV
jgi:hypothetical protein